MLVESWESDDRVRGLTISFRRKPNAVKGSVDGGVVLTLDMADGDADTGIAGTLTVHSLETGAYVDKSFSQRLLTAAILRDMPNVPGISVRAVVHDNMFKQ